MNSTVAAAAILSLAASGLTACAGGAGPVQDLAAVAGPPRPTPAPGFVAQSRPATLDYLPVGTPAPQPAGPARTAEEVRAAEAELEAVRARNEAQGAAVRRAAGARPVQP